MPAFYNTYSKEHKGNTTIHATYSNNLKFVFLDMQAFDFSLILKHSPHLLFLRYKNYMELLESDRGNEV